MRITTKLQIAAALSIGLIALLSSVYYLIFTRVNLAIVSNLLVQDIVHGVFELNVVTEDFLHHNNKYSLKQVRNRYSSLGDLLQQIEPLDESESSHIKKIRDSYHQLSYLVEEISEAYQSRNTDQNSFALYSERHKRLSGQISIQLQYMFTDTIHLSKHHQKTIQDLSERSFLFGFICLFILCAMLVAISIMIIRQIINPLTKLRIGASVIGNGNLGYQIDITSKDEIGQLATDFNLMSNKRKVATEKINSALQEKNILLQEIYHRTKNNMNIIQAILELESHSLDDEKVKHIFRETINRIMSMALIHEKLYQSQNLSELNFKEYLYDLVKSLLKSYMIGADRLKVTFDTKDIPLNIDIAIPCGMVVNEIITNSLKHAFPDYSKGELYIYLDQNPDGEIELRIKDNGIGLPEDYDLHDTDNFGMNIAVELIEKQLMGKLEYHTDGGAEFVIKFKEPVRNKRIGGKASYL